MAYKIPAAATLLGLSHSSIRRLIERGELKVIRKLRHVLIPAAEITRFMGSAS